MVALKELFNETVLKDFLGLKKREVLATVKTLRVSKYNDYYTLAADFMSSSKIAPLLLQEAQMKLLSQADDFKGTTPYIVVHLQVPFVGFPKLFTCIPEDAPNDISPSAEICKNHLIIGLSINIHLSPEKYREKLQEKFALINSYIYKINKEVHSYNNWLETEVSALIQERYEYIQQVQKALNSFGLARVE